MPILYHASTAVSIISPKLSYKTCYYSALRLHSNKSMHTDCKNAVWRVAAPGLPCKCKAIPFHLSLHKTLLIFLDQYLSSKILALTLAGSSTVKVPASLFQ